MQTHLLIDARNLAYRSLYAFRQHDNLGNPFTWYLKHLVELYNTHKPKTMSLFWDCPRKEVWRMKLHPGYKDRSNSGFVSDLGPLLHKIQDISVNLLPQTGVRQLMKKRMEADDLIYSACRVLYPDQIIIVSSDSDFIQVPFRFPNVKQYDPQDKVYKEIPVENPVLKKSLIGDKSDLIDGYDGIGKVKGQRLVESFQLLSEFLDKSGKSKIILNMILIDLSLCPYIPINDLYVMRTFADPVVYNPESCKALLREYNLCEVESNFHNLILPLKGLVS